ncbi:hypothetical protein MC885_018035, partial [Smutsia gigantea]
FPFTRPVLVSKLEQGELPWGLDPWEPVGREALRGVCPAQVTHGVQAAESSWWGSSSIPLMGPKAEVCIERSCISARILQPSVDSTGCSEKGEQPAVLRLSTGK